MNPTTDACGHDYGLPPEEREMPDPDMDGAGYRRLAGTYSSLAATCEAAGDTETAKFHRGEADRNIALGLKADAARFEADRIAARKAQTAEFLDVLSPL